MSGGTSYGFYANNTATGYGSTMYGIYSVNTNKAALGSTHGAYLAATSTSATSTVYGLYSTVSGGSDNGRYAGYFDGGKVVVMNGNAGIGVANPTQALTVKGKVAIHTEDVTSDEAYNGNLIITKPTGSGQYINLIRQGSFPWSIGTVYDNNAFAIGAGQTDDSQFTDPFFTINTNGNVGIGITNPCHKLDVDGIIRAHELLVNIDQGCDYVFADDYNLMNLSDLSSFIKTNRHLPEVAPASQMEAEGISMSEMSTLMLKKIEELTLYIIAQDKRIRELEKNAK